MKTFKKLNKLKPGDTVALISPSTGLPGLFPWVHELGVKRIHEEFGLKTQEYPTTRQMNSSLTDRAKDAMSAFSNPDIKAVIATIGGEDQIQLLRYLNTDIISQNPKPFFGYSDNTHLHNLLWNLGIPSFYGGGVMTQFAMNAEMHDVTKESLQYALFEQGEKQLSASKEYTDIGLDWSNRENLEKPRIMELNDSWNWDGEQDASGVLWGGCVESLIAQVAAEKYLPRDEDIDDCILILETSEGIPDHWIMQYLLMGLGERGWLNRFQAVLVGRPKAWEFDKQNDAETKATYKAEQITMVSRTVRQYNKSIPIVQNLDFGHTDPQICMPLGQRITLDSSNKRISAHY